MGDLLQRLGDLKRLTRALARGNQPIDIRGKVSEIPQAIQPEARGLQP